MKDLNLKISAGTGYATIDLSVKMLRPVPKDAPLLVEDTIIDVTKSPGVSEGVLKDEAGKLYAHTTTTCKLIA